MSKMMNCLKYCVASFLIFCSFSAKSQLFTEVSTEVGLNYTYPGNDFQMIGGGVMIIDVNNDGWEDFYQSGGVFDSKLWINNHGHFEDKTTEFGLDVLSGYFIQGAVGADYDKDGFQDFFIVNYGAGMRRGDKKSPVLLHNIDGERFEVIHLDTILEPGHYGAACWGDINNDGFVDLYLANYVASMGELLDSNQNMTGYNPVCYENKLLLNLNGNSFRECSKEYGLNDDGCGLAASFSDVDNDGDQDLLLLNDFGEWNHKGNKYFKNNFPDQSFEDVSLSRGFYREMYGMGIGQGDFDSDGDIDYYVTNIGQNYLFKNTNGFLEDVAQTLSLDLTYVKDSIRGTSWSGLFFDVEFDGDLDLYISKGNVATMVPKAVIRDPNVLFMNNAGVLIESVVGIEDILSHRGAAIFDFDHDGDLDIVSSVVKLPFSAFSKQDQKLKLYRNNSIAKNWIGIKLIGQGSVNRDGFGCKILFEQEETKMMREVDAGSGLCSQSSRIVYYGLNDSKQLRKATIYWTDGTITYLDNLKYNRIYEVNSNGKVKKVKL